MKYYLPQKTQEVINKSHSCRNLRLLLDKYVPQEVVNKDEAIDKKKDMKGNWLREIVTTHEGDRALAIAAYHRWYSYTSALQATHFSQNIDWRMVVGLGGNSILETDITLQHLYGIPIIPGSALKGLTRSYAVAEDKEVYIEKEDKFAASERLEDDHKDIKRIFGTEERAGSIIFFDAFPEEGEAYFELDIMNPHYPDYYQGNEPPANNQNPIPIPFLTVARTPFMFALAPRQFDDKDQEQDLKRASKWLRAALEHYGVGGKTSAGYGYFIDYTPQLALPKEAYVTPELVPEVYTRPNIPTFAAGQGIAGVVTAPTDELRHRVPEAKAFLRYREFSTKDVIIVVEAEEVANWNPGNTKNCLFVREEVRERCTILICQLGATKKKKEKNV